MRQLLVWLAVGAAGSLSGILLTAGALAGEGRVLARVKGLFGEITVVEDAGSRSMLCDGIVQTTVPRSPVGLERGTLIRGWDYVELIPYFRPRARSVLIIGLGGGLHEKALALYGMTTRYVEIDPAVAELAGRYFDVAGEVIVGDGRAVLKSESRRHDVIVVDAFQGASLPEHLYTREAFELIAGRLTPGGLAVLHLIGPPRHPAIRAVAGTLKAIFPHQQGVTSGHDEPLPHTYLFASREPLALAYRSLLESYGFTGETLCQVEPGGAPVLTDDTTNLSLLYRDIAARCRRAATDGRSQP